MRNKYDLTTWVVFVDLVKVFDRIHHKLLFKLLGKFGIPEYLIQVIRNLYSDFKSKLKSKNAKG